MFYFRACNQKFSSRMIYFRFLRSHPDVNPAKKGSPELKLANRHSEIQLTPIFSVMHLELDFYSISTKTELKFYSNFA